MPISPSAPARDFDGLYKALLDAHPREALKVLCGARISDEEEVIIEGPTEQPRQRSCQADRVYLIPGKGGLQADVYHVEIQVKRTEDFQERMVSHWASLALRYRKADHRIHQIVVWPQGGGYPGRFSRDREHLQYRAINVPDLDPVAILKGPLAALALWSKKAPHNVTEILADRIAVLDHNEEKVVQIELGMLVGGSLAAQLVDALRRRGMNDVLKHTESGREIHEEGLEEGVERGLVRSMRIALKAAYPDDFDDPADLDALAEWLAGNPDRNLARVVARVPLEELRPPE